jgi:hypothetical protein
MVSIGMGMDFAPLSIIQAMVVMGQPSKAEQVPQHAAKAHCGYFQANFKPLICSLLMHRCN